ncbi:MAG: polyphosphate kinase 2 family protein [Clostridiales bacterium]|nr:polyphosphate kinase 2 family protein [Clostridiales bacterium]
MDIEKYRVSGDAVISLADHDTGDTGGFGSSKDTKELLKRNIELISELQNRFYAEGKTGLLIVFQAMDAAGKDSAIKHVMTGVNPQGVGVYNFRKPSVEELAHDYLWRAVKVLPERGKIAIFNRSHYEDVLIGKVRRLYENYNLPDRCKTDDTIAKRYVHIRNFEDYLWENGYVILKFFLHMSKDTQRKRFLERIDVKDKNWKFSEADIAERKYWDDYMEAYESAINATSSEQNPWYIVPADKKWFSRVVISEVLLDAMKTIDPQYPVISPDHEAELAGFKQQLVEMD